MSVTNCLDREWAALGSRAADAIFTELPSYAGAGVNRDDVQESVGRNIRRAITTLRSRQAPSAWIRDEAAVTTGERAQEGVPIEDIIRGYRLSLRVIHDRFLELAAEAGMPADEILESSNLLWEVGDWFTAIAAVEYRHHAVRDAVRETMRRAELLRELLGGSLSNPRIHSAATALNIDPVGRYSVFCLLPHGTAEGDTVRAALEHLTDPPPVMAEFEGRWVGLTVDPPNMRPPRHVVAVGPRVELADLPESARIADLILRIAQNQPPGTYSLDDASWRIATLAEPAVTGLLRTKYVQPALDLGEFGELLLDSVKALLQEDLNIVRAAQKLVVHPNTLRYRLGKYEELVGVSLTSTSTIVEAAWVLGLPLAST
ncbi:CdaR family transcriptional regulator [Rhodococcus sp. JVH1]|uniref:PucR family transcriptional regulator n=1 Tax=Rhodococcus sp. JVH1 TaxID=745408 RepID=UPI00027212B4|nr:helix-turn-helix domain-containing protein [Rhodococcus sp. JVH1]EJI98396.1 hypothetical protein JVH1_4264 [Rhodococcus sp. JVH1]